MYLDQIVYFDAFNNSALRDIVYAQLLRQNYDLRTTFPPTHPTEWLARLFTAHTTNLNQPTNLRFIEHDLNQRFTAEFLFDFNETLTESELRGLWAVITNTTEHSEFLQSIQKEFNRMPIEWKAASHKNHSIYKHYKALQAAKVFGSFMHE
jgi:hypothetical protein